MCGIAGQIRFDGQPVLQDRLIKMVQALAHRGPDGQGTWMNGTVGLAHRRLAIVDLSEAGAQPMKSADGSLVITFNGEIYNYRELRKELEAHGVIFRSSSDTEVLPHLYEREGEKMLEILHGMFAFAIWDERRQELFFARDRIGKKPFFYSLNDREFSFASEIKALRDQKPEIDWAAIRTFLGLQYVPSPLTGFVGIQSLEPGCYGRVKGEGLRSVILRERSESKDLRSGILHSIQNDRLVINRYWKVNRTPKFEGSFEDAAKEVRRLAEDAVRYRMIADVPVGAFLSGGVDSSILATIMARQSSAKIQTFTMGFPSLGSDEREQAQSFAKRIGSEHYEFEARPEKTMDLVDRLVDLYDAPYADSSCLPTFLLAQETSRSVKAVVTGDGGDELFAGYRRYQAFAMAEKIFSAHLGSVVSFACDVVSRMTGDVRFAKFAKVLCVMKRGRGAGYAAMFTGSYFSGEDLKGLLRPGFLQDTQDADAEKFIEKRFDSTLGLEGAVDFDLNSYLPDDLNVKMDRATMAHGLEARAPFLDQLLVSFVARLPFSFLFQRGQQKPLLRKAFQDVIPLEVFTRPKRGFQVPLASWFRQEWRPLFVERCLADASPLFRVCRPDAVKRFLTENDQGKDHGNRLWMLLVLSTWLKRYV